MAPRATDTSVYVHFPWCLKKCPYCDFATRKIDRGDVPHDAYADAVLAELEARRTSLAGRRLISVFFGGGTPSLWKAEALGRVLAGVRAAFDVHAEDVEVTVECNPSSLDRGHAAALVAAGVGRLSVGVQSLDDARLRYLGRFHDAAQGRAALEAAMAEVPRVSADVMFGMPEQASVDDDLTRLLDMGLRHVSAYALTIEPGTQFGELYRKGRLEVAKEDDYAAMFVAAEARFAAYGLAHYEVSNYAAPGEESLHNQHYWRGGAYLGLGAAAVGCLEEGAGRARRWRNVAVGEDYVAAVGEGRFEMESEDLDAETLLNEALMLGLRTREGVDLEDVTRRTGLDPRTVRARPIARALESGDLRRDATHLCVPPDRWLHLDTIVTRLF